jgi:hypothetical protein
MLCAVQREAVHLCLAFVNARLVRLRFKRDVVDDNLDQDFLRVTQMQCNTLVINLLSFWSWNWKVCWQEGTLKEDFDVSRPQIWQVTFTRPSCNPIKPIVMCKTFGPRLLSNPPLGFDNSEALSC